jgi:hypothetical protein
LTKQQLLVDCRLVRRDVQRIDDAIRRTERQCLLEYPMRAPRDSSSRSVGKLASRLLLYGVSIASWPTATPRSSAAASDALIKSTQCTAQWMELRVASRSKNLMRPPEPNVARGAASQRVLRE